MKQDTTTNQVHSAVSDGWMHAGSFVSSIIAGTLLGFLLDQWLGTDPWLVVTGILLGSYSGFMRMWRYLRDLDERPIRDR